MPDPKNITQYLISAVYRGNNIVTHFAVHQYYNPGVSGAYKISMAQLKKLFERPGISVYTAEWDYKDGKFMVVQQVFIKTYDASFHFYVLPEDRKTKNLRHLIGLDWYEEVRGLIK